DVRGMRATRSEDTRRKGTCVPDHDNARVVPTGAAGVALCVLALFSWAQSTGATISDALSHRAFHGVVAHVNEPPYLALARSTASHVEVPHAIADMALAREAIGPHLDTIAQEWSDGVNHGYLWGQARGGAAPGGRGGLAGGRDGAGPGRRVRDLQAVGPRVTL